MGPAEPVVRPNLDWHQSRCASAGDSPLFSTRRLSMFPYLEMAGTDLSSYKRASTYPSQLHSHTHPSWRSSGRNSTCIYRVGSVRGGGSEKSRTCQPLFDLYLDGYNSLDKVFRVRLLVSSWFSILKLFIRLRCSSSILVADTLVEGP